ncbi:MAG: hypothetical protein KAT52_01220 [Desulfobacterales bacterium]|nr:hypothetical protein [Desulfobacterales bacterium]
MTLWTHNEERVSTLQDNVEAYEKYFAAKNLTATRLGSVDWIEPQTWVKRKFTGTRRQKSPGTMEPCLEEIIFIEPESPFDKLEELLNDDEKVLEIILHVRNQLNINFARQLANRLKFLFDASKEEYPEEVAILPESLRNFVGFLQSAINLKYPDVVLSPSKNIRAQWRTGPNRHFAVEFLPTGDAHFVIFSPDPMHPEKTIRMSGLASVDSLMETVQPHGVLSWSSQ